MERKSEFQQINDGHASVIYGFVCQKPEFQKSLLQQILKSIFFNKFPFAFDLPNTMKLLAEKKKKKKGKKKKKILMVSFADPQTKE